MRYYPGLSDETYEDIPSKSKSLKSNYVISKGSNDLEQISLRDRDNLYRTKNGELWYVNKQPDGDTLKMRVYIDEAISKMSLVDDKSGNNEASSTK